MAGAKLEDCSIQPLLVSRDSLQKSASTTDSINLHRNCPALSYVVCDK